MHGWIFATNVRVAFLDPSASGDSLLIAPVLGSKLRIIAYRLQCGFTGPLSMKFTDTDGNPLSQTWDFNAREGCIVVAAERAFEFQTPNDKGLQINLSQAVQGHVAVTYVEVIDDF